MHLFIFPGPYQRMVDDLANFICHSQRGESWSKDVFAVTHGNKFLSLFASHPPIQERIAALEAARG